MPTSHYFDYDLGRQRTAMADPGGRTTFTFDSLGRITLRANPSSENLYYEYDGAGNRTMLKDPTGNAVYYSYDASNRLVNVGCTTYGGGYGIQPYGTSSYGGGILVYEYDLADKLLHERRYNKSVSYYAYDAAGRTSLIQHRKEDGTTIQRYDYTRDEVGNIILQIRGTDSLRTYWNYDQANRITREAWRTNAGANVYGFDYAYDGAGNRLSKANTIASSAIYWEYDSGDQMTLQKSGSPVTVYFTYDNNGNLSVEHDVDASAGRTYYDYDPRNLLTRVDFPGATATNYFTYNANGERTRKDDSTGGKKYTWDGIDTVLEKDLAGATTQRLVKGYTPTQGIGAYALQDVSGTVIYPHKNQVGTTQRHTDSSQVITNYYEYDGWGVPIETTQGTVQQYRFNEKELDPDFIAFNSENRRYLFSERNYRVFTGNYLQGLLKPKTIPRLSIVPLAYSLGDCGNVLWPIIWVVSPSAKSDGFIIQTITIKFQVYACPGNQLMVTAPSGDTGNVGEGNAFKYREAWTVKAGKNLTDGQINRPHKVKFDDEFYFSGRPNSYGVISWYATARYHEGSELPKSFERDNPKTLAEHLPSTTKEGNSDFPPLGEGSPEVEHALIVSWFCCKCAPTSTVGSPSPTKMVYRIP